MNVAAYERPRSLDRALSLLAEGSALVIGGGTKVNAAFRSEPTTLVDLQALHLDDIRRLEEGKLSIGAMTRLQHLADGTDLPPVIREAARREEPSTLRAVATVGGCIAAADAASELLAALLAHDATVSIAGLDGTKFTSLEDLLQAPARLAGKIITAVTIELGGTSAVARVGRTRADRPIVVAVARRTPDAEIRLAFAGVSDTPILAVGIGELDPPGDFRGSSEYRRALAGVLSARVLEAIR